MRKETIIHEMDKIWIEYIQVGGSFEMSVIKLLELIIRILADKFGE